MERFEYQSVKCTGYCVNYTNEVKDLGLYDGLRAEV